MALRNERRLGLVALTSLIAAAAAPACAQERTYQSREHSFRVVTVAGGLEHPWGVAFLPGGDLLVTERPGRLRLVRDGELQRAPIAGAPEVVARGQGGLLDVILHPDFARNRLVYLSYSKPGPQGATTAVVRGRFDGARLSDLVEIFEAKAWSGGGNHFGSRFAFDAAGYLYFTVGDRAARPELATARSHPAQDLSNHQGTVIRLHDDGRVPTDNPFVSRAGALPEIWSYGHRNPQGLALDSETGILWEAEHGPQGGDELNIIRPGLNYGWPVIGFGVQYGGSVIHAGTAREGMEQPVHYWVPSIATTGLTIYRGDAFPGWRGSAFVGALRGSHVARVVLEGSRSGTEEELLMGAGHQIRHVQTGPDGLIYLLVDGTAGSVVRLEPTP